MATIEDRSQSSSFSGLVTQVVISYSIIGLSFIGFELLRHVKFLQYLYSPRCRLTKNPTLLPISKTFFSWIPNTFKISESWMLHHVGLDAVMHLRFLRSGFLIFICGTLLVAVPLLPLNHNGGPNVQTSVRESEMEIFNVGNIPNGSPLLYVHMVLMYIFSFLVMFRFWRDATRFVVFNRDFGLRQVRDGSKAIRTVMVTELPPALRKPNALWTHFQSLKLGQIEEVQIASYPKRLNKLVERRERALMQLELAHMELAKNVSSHLKQRQSSLLLSRTDSLEQQALEEITNMEKNNSAKRWWNRIFKSKSPSRTMLAESEGERDFWRSLQNLKPGSLDRYHPIHAIKKKSATSNVHGHGNVGVGVENEAKAKKSAIDHYFKKFNWLDSKVQLLKRLRGAPGDRKPTSTAFITFKNAASAQLCAQSVVSQRIGGYNVRMAPEPRDILWENLTASKENRGMRRVIINSSIWALTIFWLFPLSAILLLASYNTLSTTFPSLAPLLSKNQFMQGLLKNLLPSSINALFMSILPFAIYAISKHEFFSSYSELEWVTLNRYYRFAFFNVVIVFLIGHSFLEYFVNLIRRPADVLESLANYIPAGSTFFLNYVIFSTCIHGLELMQLWIPLVSALFTANSYLAKLPRTLQNSTKPWYFPYFYYYPLHILILVISVLYALLSPLVIPFAGIYFGVAYLVFKHQFAYAYVRKYEGGGKAWRFAFGYVCDALLIAQLTMIGILLLKEKFPAGAGLLPLVVMTIYFRILVRRLFRKRMKFIPLECLANNEVMMVPIGPTGRGDYLDEAELGVAIHGLPHIIPAIGSVQESAAASVRTDSSAESLRPKLQNNSSMRFSTDVERGRPVSPSMMKGFKKGHQKGLSESVVNLESSIVPSRRNLKRNSSVPIRERRNPRIFKLKREQNGQTESMASSMQGPSVMTTTSASSTPKFSPREISKSVKTSLITRLKRRSPDDEDQFTYESPIEISDNPDSKKARRSLRSSSGGSSTSSLNIYPSAPSRKTYQDLISDPDFYIHPALVRPLSRYLWLPRDPLGPIDLDDTVELDCALVSLASVGTGRLGVFNNRMPQPGHRNSGKKVKRYSQKDTMEASEDALMDPPTESLYTSGESSAYEEEELPTTASKS